MREGFYRDGVGQEDSNAVPLPHTPIPAETENQPRTYIKTGTANGGTSSPPTGGVMCYPTCPSGGASSL
jgi:hypothetical protein